MKKGYVFLSNSTKPTVEKANSREPVSPKNVSRPCITAALELGYDVFWGINRNRPEELSCDMPVNLFDAHTYRSITALKDNYIAFRHLSKVMNDNNIQVIHCNTPVGGMIGRVCAKRFHTKKVIYTAHGFHFYKGAPFINRTVFKWAEQIMAHWTDAIITMNQEDYEAAKRFKLRKGGTVFKVHGVGVDLKQYENIKIDRNKKRLELGVSNEDVVCISAGDIIARKNYIVAIQAIAAANNPHIHYFICGVGPEKAKLEREAEELGIASKIHFLGFRTDMKELLKISDIFLLTSLQEGLPRSLMEAMAIGLPVVASKIRGNIDLIDEGKGGYLCDPVDIASFTKAIILISDNINLANNMRIYNRNKIQEYDVGVVEQEIKQIYREVLQ